MKAKTCDIEALMTGHHHSFPIAAVGAHNDTTRKYLQPVEIFDVCLTRMDGVTKGFIGFSRSYKAFPLLGSLAGSKF